MRLCFGTPFHLRSAVLLALLVILQFAFPRRRRVVIATLSINAFNMSRNPESVGRGVIVETFNSHLAVAFTASCWSSSADIACVAE